MLSFVDEHRSWFLVLGGLGALLSVASLLALLLHNDHEQRPSCKALLKHPYVLKHIEYTMHKVRSPRMTPWHACGKSASGKWFL